MPYGRSLKAFARDLKREISNDNISNGAAALGYYLTLAIFPSLILLLSIVPYLPIAHVDQAIMDMLRQAMPAQSADLLRGIVQEVVAHKKGGLLSFGALATLWAASSGTLAVMQQLNITYDVKESRSFLKSRATSIGLTLLVGALILVAFSLIVVGGSVQNWAATHFGLGGVIQTLFGIIRWAIIVAALLLAFACTYYFGPDVDQKFSFITPGSAIGVAVLIIASVLFRLYVTNFSNYSATYGGIGAVIVLMLWLYVSGLVLLLGSEINSLVEHYSPRGKSKGEKKEPQESGKAA